MGRTTPEQKKGCCNTNAWTSDPNGLNDWTVWSACRGTHAIFKGRLAGRTASLTETARNAPFRKGTPIMPPCPMRASDRRMCGTEHAPHSVHIAGLQLPARPQWLMSKLAKRHPTMQKPSRAPPLAYPSLTSPTESPRWLVAPRWNTFSTATHLPAYMHAYAPSTWA